MKVYLKLAFLIAFIASGLIISRFTPVAGWLQDGRGIEILKSLRSAWWAGLLFVAIYVTSSQFMPSIGLSVLGGVVFGLFPGFFYNLIGVNLGACVSFWLSRGLGREGVRKVLRSDKIIFPEEALREHGLRIMIALRVIPLFPYNLVNYGLALVNFRFRDFLLGSIIGMLPATFVFTYFANAIVTGERSGRGEFLLVSAVLCVVLAAWFFLPQSVKEAAGWGRTKRTKARSGEAAPGDIPSGENHYPDRDISSCSQCKACEGERYDG